MLPIDSRAGATRAHDHKQGFGPLEKITLIIRGCMRTCPQRERRGGWWWVGGRGRGGRQSRRKQGSRPHPLLHSSMLCHTGAEFLLSLSTESFHKVGGEGAATPPAERSAAATSTL